MISETRATSGFRSEEIVCAESELDVIVTATGESDSEETEIGVPRRPRSEFHATSSGRGQLAREQAGGLALS